MLCRSHPRAVPESIERISQALRLVWSGLAINSRTDVHNEELERLEVFANEELFRDNHGVDDVASCDLDITRSMDIHAVDHSVHQAGSGGAAPVSLLEHMMR
jgi:hypothetical protein